MFFVALAVDYDGTLAHRGRVDDATIAALSKLKKSGRKLILVTGRDLSDLRQSFSGIGIFDLVVAENGGLLFDPATNEELPLGPPPPGDFVESLRNRNVSPLTVGRTIVATWEPNETTALEMIRDLGLELHIIFNKGAVMILPADINKATGLKHALKRLSLSPFNVVGIGDAENDQAFLSSCGCAVAVENALPSVKDKVDFVVADHGAGVVELAEMLAETDLTDHDIALFRIQPVIGESENGTCYRVRPFETVLVTGSSGAGKSTLVTALLEQMASQGLQFCVVDPEGDYSELPSAVTLGHAKHAPQPSELIDLLANPDTNVVANLLAVNPAERPRYVATLLPELAKLRIETGRPHWIVFDEVHHYLPTKWDPAPITLPQELPAVIAVTVHPEEVATSFINLISTVVGVGTESKRAIEKFCKVRGQPCPEPSNRFDSSMGLMWRGGVIEPLALRHPQARQQRHVRKYSEGELGEDKSFYFRGPDAALNLRARNVTTFLQLAEGVDDKTWMHHLRAAEYSKWFAEAIKDVELAAEVATIESDENLSAQQSRELIKEIVERKYTAPVRGL